MSIMLNARTLLTDRRDIAMEIILCLEGKTKDLSVVKFTHDPHEEYVGVDDGFDSWIAERSEYERSSKVLVESALTGEYDKHTDWYTELCNTCECIASMGEYTAAANAENIICATENEQELRVELAEYIGLSNKDCNGRITVHINTGNLGIDSTDSGLDEEASLENLSKATEEAIEHLYPNAEIELVLQVQEGVTTPTSAIQFFDDESVTTAVDDVCGTVWQSGHWHQPQKPIPTEQETHMTLFRVTVKQTSSRQPDGSTFWNETVKYCGYSRDEAREVYHCHEPGDYDRGYGNAAQRTILEVISDAGTNDFADDSVERVHP